MEIIVLILLIVVAALLFVASRKPDEFRVSRSAYVNAPAEIVFDHINDLHKWQSWSPWAEADPNAITTYSGPPASEGASMEWNGRKTGQGRMTIIQSRLPEFVQFRLEFFKPMKAVNTAEFTLVTEGEATHVSWTMYGPNNMLGKIMSLFMDCEKMCGDQFNHGLDNLKKTVEKSS